MKLWLLLCHVDTISILCQLKNGIPTEKQPITVTGRTEAPFLLYAGDDEKVHSRVLNHTDIKSLCTISGETNL